MDKSHQKSIPYFSLYCILSFRNHYLKIGFDFRYLTFDFKLLNIYIDSTISPEWTMIIFPDSSFIFRLPSGSSPKASPS